MPKKQLRLSTKIKRQAWLAARKAETARIRALNKARAAAMDSAPDEVLHVVDGVVVVVKTKEE